MAKALDAPYEAGRRGAGWLKVKRAHTLDLVVLAAEWGHGRRKGWLSNLHLGARDPAQRRLRDARQDVQGPDRRDARMADAASCSRATIAARRVDRARAARAGGRDRVQRPAGEPALSRRPRAALRARQGLSAGQARPRRPTPSTRCGASTRRAWREARSANGSSYIERQHPKTIALGLERVRAVLSSMHIELQCPGDHGRRHQRQGLDLRDARVDPARRRLPHRPLHLAAPAALQRARARRGRRGRATKRSADSFAAVEAARGGRAAHLLRVRHARGLVALFKREKIEAAILEVGLGGRLDAVNVVDADCAVLTSVGIDHVDYLGPRPRSRSAAKRPASSAPDARR